MSFTFRYALSEILYSRLMQFALIVESPTVADRMLHVRMLPSAVRQESGDWHVQLACGNVTSRGSLNFSVKWRVS